ncbi:MAG: hypothetical protein O2887_10470, partial [Bacteroidetes bacterium]|nr:hypothetical protein [Bacteroidota bacterium]
MTLKPIKFLGIVIRITISQDLKSGLGIKTSNWVDEIIKDIAFHHGVTPEDILGSSRKRENVIARWDVMQRLYDNNFTYEKIGELTNRDHSTVINALKRKGEIEESIGILNYRKYNES